MLNSFLILLEKLIKRLTKATSLLHSIDLNLTTNPGNFNPNDRYRKSNKILNIAKDLEGILSSKY